MDLTSTNQILASTLSRGFARHGLLTPDTRVKYLRHPLLLWHPGGRKQALKPRGSTWSYRFLGVSPVQLKRLGLAPDQHQLDDMSDVEVEHLARQLYADCRYFNGGFAALLRVPSAGTDVDSYNTQALRRLMWLFARKIGELDADEATNGMLHGIELTCTKTDAREVFRSKKLSTDEVEGQWLSLLSTFRVPTVHLIGSATAGFLMDLGTAEARRTERVDLLWSGRSMWTEAAASGRGSIATVALPALQVLYAVGTIRAVLARTQSDDSQAPLWSPKIWREIHGFLSGLSEPAWNLAMHLLLASEDQGALRDQGVGFPYLGGDHALEYAHQVLGLVPPPYNRFQRRDVTNALKSATRELAGHVASNPTCTIAPYLGAVLETSLREWVISSGTTLLLDPLLDDGGGDGEDEPLGGLAPSPSLTSPSPSLTVTSPWSHTDLPLVSRQLPLASRSTSPSLTVTSPQSHAQLPPVSHLPSPSLTHPYQDLQIDKDSQTSSKPTYPGASVMDWEEEERGGGKGSQGLEILRFNPDHRELGLELHDLGAFTPSPWRGGSDPIGDAVLQALKDALGEMLRLDPLELAILLEQTVPGVWTREGVWALAHTLRKTKPAATLKAPEAVLTMWLKGDFAKAAPSTFRLLKNLVAALRAVQDEIASREMDQEAQDRALQRLQHLCFPRFPDACAASSSAIQGACAAQLLAPSTSPSPNPEAVLVWQKALQQFYELIERGSLSQASFNNWLKDLVPVRLEESNPRVLHLWAPNPVAKLWVEQQFTEEFNEVLTALKPEEGPFNVVLCAPSTS